MPAPADPKPETRRPGVEPLRRKHVTPAPSRGFRHTKHLLVFVALVLLVDALVGEKGLMESLRARRQYREVEAGLAAIQRENRRLLEEARRLREDPAAIEAVAREQLGLIRPGEVLFIIRDEKPAR